MSHLKVHTEGHLASRVSWLRAAVLGANDGIISTASLIVGVAAATPERSPMLVAGIAGLVAGAMSMAAGEYVSVSSQADSESADLSRERRELETQPEFELNELADIYVSRGVEKGLALQVASQLMAKDAIGVHAREELGISELTAARPVQAAITSAITFAAGAALPLLVTAVAPLGSLIWVVSGLTIVFLAMLGAVGAWAGGASLMIAAARVTFWGAMAMGATALIGKLIGHAV
jgi:VIT1/CCC1 family predicted Fe2+/Mn2+ transporter